MRPWSLVPVVSVWWAAEVSATRRRQRRQAEIEGSCFWRVSRQVVDCNDCEVGKNCDFGIPSAGDVAGDTNGAIVLDPLASLPSRQEDVSTATSSAAASKETPTGRVSNGSPIGGGAPENGNGGGSSNTGAIVGGVIGGVVVLAIMTYAIFWFVLRQRPKDKNDDDRTESALALEKLGTNSPESPSDSGPSAYPAAIDTSGPLPPPPPPASEKKPLPPVQETELTPSHEREQLLPPPPPAPQRQLSQRNAPAPPPPPPPPVEPAELLSREVDSDGVSVRSFDLEQETQEPIPRLPIYTKPASSRENLGIPGQAL
ncbi:hypothetical protein EX30DRAFT_350581 [Ascodesmis nigricans]|uniref:Membrane anchor Opy2 N-terminal domain-containing protein n=1 Tax=Ascodesmis nigricans TaxID=341454 RepID=A0A4S2MRY3_9PEZI|nr:hypothetical protein EX30DRAFT_350581 [Ascodesmis nigricans]